MDIGKLRPDPAAPRPSPPVAPVRDENRPGSTGSDATVEPQDSVEISDDARSLAADSGSDVPSGVLAPDRLLELRRRIQERAQDSDSIADAVMQRLVERGEI
jgi:hypothetical protein